jgi:hypothetical protein
MALGKAPIPRVPDMAGQLPSRPPRLGAVNWNISINLSWLILGIAIIYVVRSYNREQSRRAKTEKRCEVEI